MLLSLQPFERGHIVSFRGASCSFRRIVERGASWCFDVGNYNSSQINIPTPSGQVLINNVQSLVNFDALLKKNATQMRANVATGVSTQIVGNPLQ